MRGIFGIFGRSQEMQLLDRSLRAAGLHPRVVPDAVKIVMVKQLKAASTNTMADPRAYASASALLGYCVLGAQAFLDSNDADRAATVEARIVVALESGNSLDAQLIMLTMQAGLIHASVVKRYNLIIE